MTDESAIKRIEQLATAASGAIPDVDTPAVLTPHGCEIHRLERLMHKPERMRANFTTERLRDFCGYVAGQAREGSTAVFIAPNGAGAEAVIDLGTEAAPEWATHRAELTMEYTPEFAGLLRATATAMTQQQLVDWLEDWRHIIQPFWRDEDDVRTDMSLNQAIQAVRRVNISAQADTGHEQHDTSRRRSRIEQVEATSGKGELPSGFLVTCAVYQGTIEREIDTRLSLRTSHEEPRLVLRVVGYDALLREVADEIERTIEASVGSVSTYVGSIAAQGR